MRRVTKRPLPPVDNVPAPRIPVAKGESPEGTQEAGVQIRAQLTSDREIRRFECVSPKMESSE